MEKTLGYSAWFCISIACLIVFVIIVFWPKPLICDADKGEIVVYDACVIGHR